MSSTTPPDDGFGPPLRQGGLELRPVAGPAERDEVIALRALAFRGDSTADDRDDWDAAGLHLRAARDGGAAIGAVRLLTHPPGDATGGYAGQHYDLRALSLSPGPALELGRLCLHPRHPDPDVLRLIWAGVARVALARGAARLIGCTSFRGTDPGALAPALGLLARRHLGPPELRPSPRAAETCALADFVDDATPEATAALPPLLRAYLALGGWVGDRLVIDRDLGTCHVFTCLEIAAMPASRRRRLAELAGG